MGRVGTVVDHVPVDLEFESGPELESDPEPEAGAGLERDRDLGFVHDHEADHEAEPEPDPDPDREPVLDPDSVLYPERARGSRSGWSCADFRGWD